MSEFKFFFFFLPGLLTVIYKNSSKSTIHKNVDTTLFIKVSHLNSRQVELKPTVTTLAPAAPHGFNIDDCVAHSQAIHQLARKIREKRLMYHMGLKGKPFLAERRFSFIDVVQS